MAPKPRSHQDENGKWHHNFRQSWLGQHQKCQEQARLELVGELARMGTDAAVFGTCVHAVIERKLNDNTTNVISAWNDEWARAIEGELTNPDGTPNPITHWIQLDPGTAQRWGQDIVQRWLVEVYPRLRPLAVEQSFDVVLSDTPEREIRLKGTIDLVDERLGVVDWKTASEEYKRWKFQRYAIQPTVYTKAAHELGLVTPTDGVFDFTYMVFPKGKPQHQEMTVTRTEQHWLWLTEMCDAICDQIENGVAEAWPRGDTDWWCSPKWCPAWSSCKGLLLAE